VSEKDGGGDQPPFEVLDGGKKPKKRGPIRSPMPITREAYDRMVSVHVQGSRSIGELVRTCKVARETAQKAIHKGWPEKGWKPLKEHAAHYDRMAEAVTAAPADPARAEEAASWEVIRRQHLDLAIATRSVLAGGLVKLQEAMERSTITTLKPRRRTVMEEVIDREGKVIRRIPRTVTEDVEVAPNLTALFQMLSDCSAVLARTGGHEIDIANAKAPAWMRQSKGWSNLTSEQLQYMWQHDGRLPPGVTLEMLTPGA
jgi:hypothetical protein